ncbi:hypothetical protein ARMGADRAFT_1025196 [Armillaria gallica]|uniref:CxC2-like cysteine cluster KDZ transposase-associated domain-containing protein n=1 Tax=Armillaria gallica TaxID=47427 RepID=A0A2H3E208_ARMGA|nr:hypothetical protein ARMGADRAFT_1025196 [Armillaria gallica]
MPAHKDFTVLHSNSVHTVSLLQASWWPATPIDPQTMTMFTLLRLFHMLNCQGKMPVFDMWKSLYKVLLHTIHQWRHLKQCKQAGYGHNAGGVSGTSLGELGLDCWACPHPGKNMPPISEIEELKHWLYTQFLALDANYWAWNVIASTEEWDPPLGGQLGLFCGKGPIHGAPSQVLTFLANIKNVCGFHTTGIVGCSVMLQALNNVEVEIIIFYNIICQWGIHFWDHMAEFPDNARLKITLEAMVMCVSKFHLWVHKSHCHAHFSFNYVPGAGQTHGETIKENWADSNKAMAQMKMMGPGAWQDTLDDIFGFHNYRVMANFDHVLANRLACAIREACIHRDDFKRFNKGVEEDHSKPCLYEATLQGKETLQEVGLALAREEHENSVKVGIALPPSSLSSFLMTGIQLEEAQCTLELEVKARSMGTMYQQLDIQRHLASFNAENLKGHEEWEEELWLLRDEDVHGINERVQTEEELWEQDRLRDLGVMDAIGEPSSNWNLAQRGDSKRIMSWIWYELRNTDDNPATIKALRIEWCKAHARMLQWDEEVKLLNEEMCRVIAFVEWKAHWWLQRVALRADMSMELQEGLKAFALEHTVWEGVKRQ